MHRRFRGAVYSSFTAALLGLGAACGHNSYGSTPTCDGGSCTPPPPAPDGGSPTPGSANLTSATPAANGNSFAYPLDATPSPDGTQIYFTGIQPGASPGGPGIFKVAAAGGATSSLTAGGSIGVPLAVAMSSDGSKVYVADPAYGTNVDGAVFSVASAGGSPTVLTETEGYAPRAVAVAKVGGSDNVYFIGDDKANRQSGIFKDASGTISAVIEGSAANDPQAVAAYSDGTLYFIDGSGSVQRIAAGGTTATALPGAARNLAINFPAGIDVSQDGKFLVVPVTDPATHGESIARIDVTSGNVTQLPLGLSKNSESGGIHRAAAADVYAFVDSGAGSTGTVYLLK